MGASWTNQQAIEAAFVGGWHSGGVMRTPVALPNVRGLLNATDGSARIQKPTADDAWVRFVIREQGIGQIDMGDPATVRTLGRAEVQIYVPVGEGTREARDLGDEALLLFERMTIGAAKFRCADASHFEVGRDESWWRYDVTVPYYRDRLVAMG